jgi:hypothetical protein
MDPFARFTENLDEMSERPPHLRLLDSPFPWAVPTETDTWSDRRTVAFLHEWRAAKIAASKAMHPTNLARAAAVPALQSVPEPLPR